MERKEDRSDCIDVSKDIRVQFLEKDPKYYLNRSTILFGASNSGKSTILIEILHILKDHVPNIFVFSPTSDTNNTFDKIVPPFLIYKTLDIKRLEEIYKRQHAAAMTYNTVNNLAHLRELFTKVATFDELKLEGMAKRKADQLIDKNKYKKISLIIKKGIISDIERMKKDYLKKLYKDIIKKNKKRLYNMNLTTNQLFLIKYLNFNPNCVVVLDDCGAMLKKFQKEEVVKKIIFQGRHSYINLILTLQDDLNLDSSIKKNAFVNIFTTSRCASAYFERSSNNFSKKEKATAEKIISHVFTPSSKNDFKKLVYLRDDINPFRYTIADIYEDFRFGSPYLWAIYEKMEEEKQKKDFADPMNSGFTVEC